MADEENTKAKLEEGDSPEDYLKIINSSDNEEEFELICKELSNKNARKILKEVAYGIDTSTSIVEKTGLTLQDVLIHLDRLVATGLIERSTSKAPSFRGRKPIRYQISRVGVLLIPEEEAIMANKPQIKQNMRNKALSRIKRRIALTIASTSTLEWLLFRYLLNYFASLRVTSVGGGNSATPLGANPFSLPKANATELEAAILIAILASPFVYVGMRKLAKLLIH